MSHFAKVFDGIVVQVIVAEREFIDSLPDSQRWIQTSYNTYGGQHATGGTPLRKNFAAVGHTYDAEKDAFIPIKPYDSWTLNEDTCLWDAPVAKPEASETQVHRWDEEAQEWFLKFEFIDGHWEDKAPDREVVAQNTFIQSVIQQPVELSVLELATESIQSLTTEDLQPLSSEQVVALSTDQIQSANSDQIQSLTTDQIQSLTTDQIQSLTTDQIQNLTTDQISAFEGNDGNLL